MFLGFYSYFCPTVAGDCRHMDIARYVFRKTKHVRETKKKMVKQSFIIFACLALGHFIVWATGISLPASIIGMILLALSLRYKVVAEESVQGISDFLISNMGFFFVPPGVALMLYLDIIRAEILPIVVATVASTVLVLVSTGWGYRIVKKSRMMESIYKLIRKDGAS